MELWLLLSVSLLGQLDDIRLPHGRGGAIWAGTDCAL